MNCTTCGFPVDSDSHVYNVNCVAANAEYDQLLAEVHECQDQTDEETAEDRAFDNFVRLVWRSL